MLDRNNLYGCATPINNCRKTSPTAIKQASLRNRWNRKMRFFACIDVLMFERNKEIRLFLDYRPSNNEADLAPGKRVLISYVDYSPPIAWYLPYRLTISAGRRQHRKFLR